MTINSVYLNFPIGKPILGNPNEFGLQSGQKGLNCFYYATNYIRERFKHKGEAVEATPERSVERTISLYRKNLTACNTGSEGDLEVIAYLIENIRQHKGETSGYRCKSKDRKELEEIFQAIIEYKEEDEFYTKSAISKLKRCAEILNASALMPTGLMTDFLNASESDDFREYFNKNQCAKEIQITKDFLVKMDEGLKDSSKLLDLGKNFCRMFFHKTAWENYTSYEQYVLLHQVAVLFISKSYRLQASIWSPDGCSIEGLITSLRLHGPMVVAGWIGFHCYKPGDVRLLAERPFENTALRVYGFVRNAERLPPRALHSVVIVGANQLPEPNSDGNTGYVYFIDSAYPVDPKEVEKSVKIVKLSYLRLKEVVVPLATEVDPDFEVVSSTPPERYRFPAIYGVHRRR